MRLWGGFGETPQERAARERNEQIARERAARLAHDDEYFRMMRDAAVNAEADLYRAEQRRLAREREEQARYEPRLWGVVQQEVGQPAPLPVANWVVRDGVHYAILNDLTAADYVSAFNTFGTTITVGVRRLPQFSHIKDDFNK